MAILSKGCKPDNFESHNSLMLSFINAFAQIFWIVNLSFNQHSPDILSLCETNLDDSIDSGNLFVGVYLPLIRKGLATHLNNLPSSSFWMVFDSISSNIDEVLLVNPFANVFIFGEFNAHPKDWLTYSGRTDRPDELYYSFSISNNLTQMVNFLTRIPDWFSQSCCLGLFVSSHASICSAMAFPP